MPVLNRYFRKLMMGGNAERERMSLDTFLAGLDRGLDNFDELVRPALESRPRTPFDSDLPQDQISMANLSFRQILSMLPFMAPFQRDIRRGAKLYDSQFKPNRSEASSTFLQQLESEARAAGATAVKYVKVPNYAIFREKGIPHEYAIIFTIAMDEANIATAPSFTAMREVVKGYKNLARISYKVAQLLRIEGFAAYPGTALGGLSDYPHLAEIAGLGAIGYHGLLITPSEGPRSRINIIYTNITNLPIEEGANHLWIRDLCAMCKQCIRRCPPKAIFEQPVPRGDGGMQCIDHGLCRNFFQANYGCAICIAVCPFSRKGYEKIQARFKGNEPAPRFRIPVVNQRQPIR